jgi:hypothetical protein
MRGQILSAKRSPPDSSTSCTLEKKHNFKNTQESACCLKQLPDAILLKHIFRLTTSKRGTQANQPVVLSQGDPMRSDFGASRSSLQIFRAEKVSLVEQKPVLYELDYAYVSCIFYDY